MKYLTCIANVLLLCVTCSAIPGKALADDNITKRAVLVTGASSGIGRNTAIRLAGEGFYVYAGARKPADIEALSAIENVEGIRLDVTIQADIDAAVETVQSQGRGLHGVVNNAGVVTMGILAETPETELDFVFDVNVYGPYRVVKAFAPLLIKSRGRIVNISSMAGIKAAPAFGVYSMSKHAIESFTESLIFEMGYVGVHATVIEPGPFNSNAIASNCKRREKQEEASSSSLFPELAGELAQICNGEQIHRFPEPDAVADAVLHALSAAKPNDRYLAVTDSRHAEGMIRSTLQKLAQLNSSGHTFGFSEDELVRMLKEALTHSESD